MADRQHAYIAREGWYFIGPLLGAAVAAWAMEVYLALVPLAAVLLLMVLLFHDPARTVRARPLGVVSPVDGRVMRVERVAAGVLGRPAWRVCIRVNNFGAYSARSPIEGQVMELGDRQLAPGPAPGAVHRGLWVRGDDNSDVVLVLHAVPLLGRPRAVVRYGERIGQGQRCACLRVTRDADVYMPDSARPTVRVGERVLAGSSTLASLVRRAPRVATAAG